VLLETDPSAQSRKRTNASDVAQTEASTTATATQSRER
jgi:hypothetical protein